MSLNSSVLRMLNWSLFRVKLIDTSHFTVCSPHVNILMTAADQSCLTKWLNVMFCFSLWVTFPQMPAGIYITDCFELWRKFGYIKILYWILWTVMNEPKHLGRILNGVLLLISFIGLLLSRCNEHLNEVFILFCSSLIINFLFVWCWKK